MPVEGVDAWPLYWPEGWKRTDRFSKKTSKYEVHFVKARDEVLRSLKLMRAKEVCISTNVPLRRDGLPLANMREPDDTGVAVYWVEEKWNAGKVTRVTKVLACDQWRTVRDNLRAIGLSLEAFRAIDRAGASEVLNRAFTGFTALPASASKRTWRDVLGFIGTAAHATRDATRDAIDTSYRQLAAKAHPDAGGSHERMVELNRAREEALREIGA